MLRSGSKSFSEKIAALTLLVKNGLDVSNFEIRCVDYIDCSRSVDRIILNAPHAITISDCAIYGLWVEYAEFSDVSFSRCRLENFSPSTGRFKGVSFSHSQLIGASLSRVIFEKSVVLDSVASATFFPGASNDELYFARNNLSNVVFGCDVGDENVGAPCIISRDALSDNWAEVGRPPINDSGEAIDVYGCPSGFTIDFNELDWFASCKSPKDTAAETAANPGLQPPGVWGDAVTELRQVRPFLLLDPARRSQTSPSSALRSFGPQTGRCEGLSRTFEKKERFCNVPAGMKQLVGATVPIGASPAPPHHLDARPTLRQIRPHLAGVAQW